MFSVLCFVFLHHFLVCNHADLFVFIFVASELVWYIPPGLLDIFRRYHVFLASISYTHIIYTWSPS